MDSPYHCTTRAENPLSAKSIFIHVSTFDRSTSFRTVHSAVLKDCDPVVLVAMGLWCRHSQEECEAAVKGLHNQELDGGRIKVTLILANAASSGGGY